MLQSGSQEEMSVCPRCHESVPRTLYCLNCGYPLYREVKKESPRMGSFLEEGAEAQPIDSFKPESRAGGEEVRTLGASEERLVEITEKVMEGDVKVEEEPAEAVQDKTIETVPVTPAAELVMGAETTWVGAAESTEIPIDESTAVSMEALEVREEEPTVGALEEKFAEFETSQGEAAGEEEAVEALEVAEQSAKPEVDPIIFEVMSNLARNVSLRIKLIDLAMRGEVRETTLRRLLGSYAAKGELWINKRNEILERSSYEVSTLEKALENVKAELEELKIRRAIGDASDDEYAAKAPSYEWDIHHLSEKLAQKRLEIGHLESLSKVMPINDFENLKAIALSCQRNIDELASTGRMSPETVAEMKSILEEALELIKG